MVEEVLAGLAVAQGKRYIDATIGGGGHGWEIVKRGGDLLGIDADREALEFAKEHLTAKIENRKSLDRYKIVQGNFGDIEHIAKEHGFSEVDGILFDLGVSSHQLETPDRGFSYRYADAPIDLRFSQNGGQPAGELIHSASEEELYDILATFGEEQLARPIARALFRARALKPVLTTGDVREAVLSVIKSEKNRSSVLSRVFQALRIAVNDELGALREGLEGAWKLLRRGGRIVVISFHSLEDRIVKREFLESRWKLTTKKPLRPDKSEIAANIRSRSARMRVAERA